MFLFPFTIAISAIVAFHRAHASPVTSHKYVRQRDTPTDYASQKFNGTLPLGYEVDTDLENSDRCDIDFCAGTIDSGNTAYVCGDARLGPVILPSCLPLSTLVGGSTTYGRFGGLCPGEFISMWTNYASAGEVSWFMYPFSDGFANNTAGSPIRGHMTLKPGTQVDRFGSARGNFVASAGSPYSQRALPPANLDFDMNDPTQVPYNYHVYEVEKAVVVIGGPVAPWFGQPGLGMQFLLPKSIEALIKDGVLSEIAVTQQCSAKAG
ncbi:hypothetical protein HBI81_204280 [Parastagonospora nodorum]|nr:hypothetical protein HBI81_204280 [Parastagonospora nodorum]